MTTPTYASAINGWNAPAVPGVTPVDYYAGPAGAAPGGASFAASVLFQQTDHNANDTAYLWSNEDAAGFKGWSLASNGASFGSFGLNAQVGDGAAAFVIANYNANLPLQGLVLLTMSVRSGAPGLLTLYLNGQRVSQSNVNGVASARAPSVGVIDAGAGLFASGARGVQIFGVSYLNQALGIDNATEARAAAAHFEACQRATDMAKLDAGVPGGVDWTNRWSVREGAVSAAGGVNAPAIWLPSAGSANLTRVTTGTPTLAIETPTNPNWL